MAPFPIRRGKLMPKAKPTLAYTTAIAQKALKLVKKDKRVNKQEMKYVFNTLGSALPYDVNVYNTTKQLSFCSGLNRGTGAGAMIGDFVHAKRLEIRYRLTGDDLAIPNASVVRMTIVRYKEPQQVPSTYSTNSAPFVFADSGVNQTSSVFNQQGRLNFVVLYDKYISLGSGGSPGITSKKAGKIILPLNFDVRIATAVSGPGNVIENDLVFYVTSDIITGGGPPRIDYQFLFYYTDA